MFKSWANRILHGETLDDLITRWAKRDSHLASFQPGSLSTAFTALALPDPRRNDAFMSKDSGLLLFLSRYGCVIRIRPTEKTEKHTSGTFHRVLSHTEETSDDVLQPILRRHIGPLSIEILPGVHIKDQNQFEARKLDTKLLEQGLNFYDCAPRNIGQTPDGITRLIDIGAITPLASRPPTPKSPQSQIELYKSLIETCDYAWPEDQHYADEGAAKLMWTIFAREKEKGLLKADWDKKWDLFDDTNKLVTGPASNYGFRMRCAGAVR